MDHPKLFSGLKVQVPDFQIIKGSKCVTITQCYTSRDFEKALQISKNMFEAAHQTQYFYEQKWKSSFANQKNLKKIIFSEYFFRALAIFLNTVHKEKKSFHDSFS